jgi:5-(carboxyamino)imidazole ribonucleotide mutase
MARSFMMELDLCSAKEDKGNLPLSSSMPVPKVVLILGSEHDQTFAAPIKPFLDRFGIACDLRVASAHKDSERLLKIIEEYEKLDARIVYVTVAGMSNALSGFVDFKTKHPVIACPPKPADDWNVDIYSSLRMPKGVASLVTCDPENAALAAIKILGETDEDLARKVREYQREMRLKNEKADERMRQPKAS